MEYEKEQDRQRPPSKTEKGSEGKAIKHPRNPPLRIGRVVNERGSRRHAVCKSSSKMYGKMGISTRGFEGTPSFLQTGPKWAHPG